MKELFSYTFEGRIPSKKNSKRIFMRGRRPFIASSEEYVVWNTSEVYKLRALSAVKLHETISNPVSITCYFYFPDKRTTDLSNKFESIADTLVDAGIISDDNKDLLPEIHLYYKGIDKLNPRVEIKLLEIPI